MDVKPKKLFIGKSRTRNRMAKVIKWAQTVFQRKPQTELEENYRKENGRQVWRNI